MIDEANAILREKGYSAAKLAAHTAPLAGKALLKGSSIRSPFSDSPETILRVVKECVPPADQLGRQLLTPQEFRRHLEGRSAE